MAQYDAVVVGSGISGAVVAREMAQHLNYNVLILERRLHVGGNMYDYMNDAGILVHKYGPHTFHTTKKDLYDYICRYSDWEEYHLKCGAVINGKYTPTPFNFQTIDDFFELSKAAKIKAAIRKAYPDQEKATVLELLEHEDSLIREYAKFLFDNDYSLYTAKQWGVSPSEIDPSVLKRVPLKFNYEEGYFDDEYQVMPKESYSHFFQRLLSHSNIHIEFGQDALKRITLNYHNREIMLDGNKFNGPIVYSGAIDALFDCKFGMLPYRSLRFEWKTEDISSFQMAPVVAYPQVKDFTRITEYTKLPVQNVGRKTSYAIEYSLPYRAGVKSEPYYPVLTEDSTKLYSMYVEEANKFSNLYLCGRLAEFKYYNMDQALERALAIAAEICQ